MTGEILSELENGVLTLQLNRPEQKNALSLAMYTALTERLESAQLNPEVKVVLLHGSADCFTSGNDLQDFAGENTLAGDQHPTYRFLISLSRFPKPVVVAVTGVAVGIGTTLLLHSDLVFASPDSSFRLPFVNLGLCPEFASSLLLPRLAGHVKACEWLLLGEFFGADEALRGRLINAVVDDPIGHARLQCQKLVKQPPEALCSAKALLKSFSEVEIHGAIHQELEVFSKALRGPEFAEAVEAFFAKRAPDFSKLQSLE